MASTPKILIVGPAWVGDMVMAQSLFRQLKTRTPAPEIHVLAPAWTHALLGHMPEVTAALEMPVGHGQLDIRARWSVAKKLRAESFNQAIILPGSLKSALIPWLAKIPLRTGFRGEMRYGLVNDMRKLDKKVLTLTVQRFVALGLPSNKELGIRLPRPRLEPDSDGVKKALSRLKLSRDEKPLLVLCPGAEYGPAKRWPPASFGEIARDRIAAGWSVWLFGSSADREATAEVNAIAGRRCIDLAGRTRLEEVIDLMSLASAVVSNDSGLMHVAAALDRPLVALYGSSDPGFTPPLNDQALVIYLNLDCSPCFKRECPLGHLNCLNGIEPARVLQNLEQAIGS